MKIKCGCKVNLYLRVMDKREDGYHTLDTLFYPIATPFDILEIEEKEASACPLPKCKRHDFIENISVQCDTDAIDLKNNTLTKAYTLYAHATGFAPKINIILKKGIPHGAGLGGGSSDAAALLTYLQKKNPAPLSVDSLVELATKIGADVPFFLINTPCKAKGIGEILAPTTLQLGELKLYLVLITPHIHISTKWAFLKLDEERKYLTAFHAFDKNHRSCFDKDFTGDFLEDFFWENDFEALVFSKYPLLGEIKRELIKNGASVALLSGSGSSLFGLFRNLKNARKTTEILGNMFNYGENRARVYDPIEVI